MKRIFALTTLALALAACDTKTTTTTETTSGAATTSEATASGTAAPASGAATVSAAGKADTLVIQRSSDIPTTDPGTSYDTASGEVLENVYETLVTYKGSSTTELEGVLATEWKEEDGGKRYTFTLRPDVKFHSGNPFTCADAEYTFQRNLITNTADSGNWFLSESLLGTGANAKDDKNVTWDKIDAAVQCDGETLVFNLPKSDPAFLSKLAYTGQSIVDSKHAKEVGEWDGTGDTMMEHVGVDLTGSPLAKDPSGTGPYQIVSNDSTGITLKAFDGYWGGAPAIKNVVLSIVPEQSSRIQAFLNGDADLIESGGREVVETQLAGQPGVKTVDGLESLGTFGFTMNQDLEGSPNLGSGTWGDGLPANFFQDENMRKCFASAFDYQAYIEQVQMGKGEQLNTMLPKSFLGYDESLPVPQYDMAAAEEACKAAHGGQAWENGFTLNAAYREGSKTMQTALEILKMNLEGMNPKFKVNIQPLQWSEVISKADEQPMIYVGWSPDYGDPDNFIRTFYHSQGYYHGRAGFTEPELDKLIDQARNTTDEAQRKALYSQIAQLAAQKNLYLQLPTPTDVVAVHDNLQGATLEGYNAMNSGTWLWKNLSKTQ
ncbi:ABC-type transporter, periplasmic subunit [Deinococcus proteolyticus MRP]|uniref:ABC-type transporter, periplasmic subunit n=1 Tax=Deinococcus proteolyticus (strain ATCC 35074 / DSM 20540 / JCM 6276 / NBRC 101906 / NCIMB 13154 / VKM Ac-1939 / CCM 2703 / MRP) TaxID=693977 RepID=F0RPA7_DEIPM|nr:ABC transporter substrate-binding protein [Deinococcus proteolyticus]ADY26450.1 ABC-type transporter, periplasmic subunit [Deinococcus proteolyticus MRP]